MSKKNPANREENGVKRDNRGRYVKGTPPPNPAGRPPLGESWREIFDKAGKLTRGQLLDLYPLYGKRLDGLPYDVPLRDAVALSALVTLACEPSPGLLSAIMERVDGKVAQPFTFEDMTEDQKLDYVRQLLSSVGFVFVEPEKTGMDDQAIPSDPGK